MHVPEEKAATIVVGAAIVHDRRVLVQQRARPVELAGRWELPGGRVEAGETDQDALVRECQEELDVRVDVNGRVGPDVPLPGGALLRVYAAALCTPDAVPTALEHLDVRWVSAGELADLDWVEADRVFLPDLRALL